MRNLSYSFKPDGTYFIFDIGTGATVPVARPDGTLPVLRSPRAARMEWIRQRGV